VKETSGMKAYAEFNASKLAVLLWFKSSFPVLLYALQQRGVTSSCFITPHTEAK
jgi:hypothetical protein